VGVGGRRLPLAEHVTDVRDAKRHFGLRRLARPDPRFGEFLLQRLHPRLRELGFQPRYALLRSLRHGMVIARRGDGGNNAAYDERA
jgi:hypothetical protein